MEQSWDGVCHICFALPFCGLPERAWCPRCTQMARNQRIIWGQAHVAHFGTLYSCDFPSTARIKVTVVLFNPQQLRSDGILRLSEMSSYAVIRGLPKIVVSTLTAENIRLSGEKRVISSQSCKVTRAECSTDVTGHRCVCAKQFWITTSV